MPCTLTQVVRHAMNTVDAAAASMGAYVYTYIRLYMYIMLWYTYNVYTGVSGGIVNILGGGNMDCSE